MEPLDARNQAALGYDTLTEPTRRAALERAWLSGEPALSGKVILKQEIDPDKQVGFLLYIPVYRGGAVPASEAERREKLEGLVYCAFRAGDLFNAMFPPDHQPRIAFRVYDGPEARPEQLLYESSSKGEPPHESPRFSHTSHLEFGGLPWTLVFTSSASFEQALLTPWVPALGVLGLLLSLLVSADHVDPDQRAATRRGQRGRASTAPGARAGSPRRGRGAAHLPA